MVEWLCREKITDDLEEAYNDVLIWNDDDDWNRGIKEGIYIAMSRINAMTSANKKEMVPVVRCRDCKYWQKTNLKYEDDTPVYDCPFWNDGYFADENGYCSGGRKR